MSDNTNIVITKGTIKSVSNKYDKGEKNVYFQLESLDPKLVRNHYGLVECLGPILEVHKGEPVKIVGKFEQEVLVCATIEITWLSREQTIQYLTSRCRAIVSSENAKLKMEKKPKMTGLGEKKVTMLVDKFGEDILTLGDEDLRNRILMDPELSGIGDKLIKILLKARTKADIVLKSLCDELLNYKVSTDDILHIRSTCVELKISDKPEAILNAIRKDPYRIMLASGVSMRTADEYAYSLSENEKKKFSATDPKRVYGYVINALHQATDNGHTYITTKELVQKINNASKRSKYGVEIPACYISMVFAKSGPSSVMLDKDTKTVSLTKYHNAEIQVAQKLVSLVNNGKSTFTVTEEEIDEVAAELKLSFGSDQRKAFRILECPGVAILTGGPGTGKTTVVNGLVTLYKKHFPKAVIKFCAPTGRAAKQLTRSVRTSLSSGQTAETIHKMINYNPFGGGHIVDEDCLPKDKENPLEADLIIVDESSMISIEVMQMLLDAVKLGTLVVFVGDEHQLPCIGAGNCLHDLIASNVFPVFRLKENFRQKGAGTIVQNASLINDGKMPVPNQDDFVVISTSDDNEGYKMLCRLMTAYYDKRNPFAVQLIEPSYQDSAGIYRMNRYVREEICYKGWADLSKNPMVGDKIIITDTEKKQDKDKYDKKYPEYDYDMYINGDLGVIVTITDEEVIVHDGFDDVHYDPSCLRYMDFAYSYTIHKSQGSEADTVIVYLPKSKAHMMTRSLLYTAVTRAKKKVIIVETEDALETCVKTIDADRRTKMLGLIVDFWKQSGKKKCA